MAACSRRTCCGVCVLGVAVLIGREPLRATLDTACFAWMTYGYAGLAYSTWRKDMRYFGSQPIHAHMEQTFQFRPGDDHTTRVCRLSLYLKFAEELHSGIIMTPITSPTVTLPPEQRAEAYVQACREVFEGMPEGAEQRRVLEGLEPVPAPWQFHINVTHPWMNGRFTDWHWGGLEMLMGRHPGVSHAAGSEAQWDREREAAADALPSLDDRLKPQEELAKLPGVVREGLKSLGIRPVRDERVSAEGITEALANGRTMVFDATEICGKEIFNLTVPDIARLHGDLSATIPTFKLNSAGYGDGTFDTLEELGHRFQTWRDKGWQDYPDFGPFPTAEDLRRRDEISTPSGPLVQLLERAVAILEGKPVAEIHERHRSFVHGYRQSNTQTTINTKRLPKFPLKNMSEAMGSPSWLGRLWNLLWIGPVGDFWHFDEEDNLLICVSGEIYVAVLEQNVTDIVAGTRNVGLGHNNMIGFFQHRSPWQPHWIDSNKWMQKMPMHFLKLEPGMGITVPSRTYHNVMALDGNRILMNCFFMPKYKALETVPASKYSWWKAGTQADTFRALWHLKASSIWRLWDTRKIGGFFAGYKLEFM